MSGGKRNASCACALLLFHNLVPRLRFVLVSDKGCSDFGFATLCSVRIVLLVVIHATVGVAVFASVVQGECMHLNTCVSWWRCVDEWDCVVQYQFASSSAVLRRANRCTIGCLVVV
jgi:hypothetical protein